MNLESQVCNLELSNKFKELEVKQDSYFAWFDNPFEEKWEVSIQTTNKLGIPAFTSSELMSLLPHRITLKENEPFNDFTLYIKKSFIVKGEILLKPEKIFTNDIYIINYECDTTEMAGEDAWLKRPLFPHNIWDENFSNALAKTLIYLIENKIINL